MRVWIVVGLIALAGCSAPPEKATEDDEKPASTDPLVSGNRDLRVQLLANDTISSPLWQVGDRYQFVFRQQGEVDTEFTVPAVVKEETDGGYELWSPAKDEAAWHAAFGFPVLGSFAKDSLSTSYYGEVFSLFDFPLTDGHTWETNIVRLQDPFTEWIENLFDDNPPPEFDVTMVATYNPEMSTPLGMRPGYDIVGTVDGDILLEFDYVPAVGWFTVYREYQNGYDGPDSWTQEISLKSYARNWTGTLYQASATQASDYIFALGADPGVDPTSPGPPGSPQVIYSNTLPSDTMNVDNEALYGLVLSAAFGGYAETRIFDPQNQIVTTVTSNGLPPQFFDIQVVDLFIEAPATGSWRIAVTSGGAGAGGGAWLWDATFETFEL